MEHILRAPAHSIVAGQMTRRLQSLRDGSYSPPHTVRGLLAHQYLAKLMFDPVQGRAVETCLSASSFVPDGRSSHPRNFRLLNIRGAPK